MTFHFADIISVILIISNVFIYLILRKELKSKSRIIEDLTSVLTTAPLDRLSKYYEDTEKLRQKFVMMHVDTEMRQSFENFDKKAVKQFDEMGNFIASFFDTICKRR